MSTYLSHLAETARRAYVGTSFDPKERGERTLADHEQELVADLAEMPEEEHANYLAKYEKMFTAWLHARGNVFSTMITGPANFNVARNNKALLSEHNRLNEFRDWRTRALEAIKKKVRDARPEEEKMEEQWESIKQSILKDINEIVAIREDKKECGYGYYVKCITRCVTNLAEDGEVELTQKAIAFVKESSEQSGFEIIPPRYKFDKLLEVANAKHQEKVDKANKPNREIPFVGGTLIYNYAIERVQLKFDNKPDAAMVAQLKKRAFKWAPSMGVWQRQYTQNGVWAAGYILKDNNLVIPKEESAQQ